MPQWMAQRWLLVCGLISLVAYVAIYYLSGWFVPASLAGDFSPEERFFAVADPRFEQRSLPLYQSRPILAVLGMFGVAYLAYLGAVAAVWKLEETSAYISPPAGIFGSPALQMILGFALLFRVVQLFALPIQEIDIYRYMWDGRVMQAGVNPYAFTPNEALREAGTALSDKHTLVFRPETPAGQRLAGLLAQPKIWDIHLALDHRNVSSVYPPASQAIFVLAAAVTPVDLPVLHQVIILKAVLLGFDVGTIGFLLLLLRALGRSTNWVLAYAWCPLVIKEFANSGHLDSVAVMFTTAAVWLIVRQRIYLGMTAWGLAILAKFYPLILTPFFVRMLWSHQGWKSTAIGAMMAAVVVGAGQGWFWLDGRPLSGLRVFLSEWEMNAVLFPLAQAGLRRLPGDAGANWLTAQAWWPRRVATAPAAAAIPVEPAFLATYLLAVSVVLAAAVFAARRIHSNSAGGCHTSLVQGMFLTLAIMFLAVPTANPWYLTWMIPFLPWARQASWFLLPGLAFNYYMRFWFLYHYPEGQAMIPGTQMDGREFFHRVWVWVEYLPFFTVVGLEIFRKRRVGPTPGANRRRC